MKKIPTVFRRNSEGNRRHVIPVVVAVCAWVLAGEGVATRKYDGTCVMCDEHGEWWARREVKPGKQAPHRFVAVAHDELTGKTVGWEPVARSPFAKFHAEALAVEPVPVMLAPGTYELCGPKINGNREGYEGHVLVRHADAMRLVLLPCDFDGLREWLTTCCKYEGVVWHHPDGRMAKLKVRDFGAVR